MARSKEKPKSAPKPQATSGAGGRAPLPLWMRIALSLAVAWHLFAVFIAPFSVPPSSELVARIARPAQYRDQPNYLGVQWYTDPLYLNHGYHFFAPNPPVNQLVRYAVFDDTGAVIAEGEFPNKEQQWPRLYYHRHMMLADQAALMPAANPQSATQLALRSYGRYLLRRHEGVEVRLDCVRHLLMHPYEVIEGADPNALERFEPVTSVVEYSADLGVPLITPRVEEPIPPGAIE